MRTHNRTILILLLVLLACGTADNAWALQTHGAREGIYVHQMAHILFTAALAYLYWHTRRTQETTSKGWKYLQIFCIFLILWNLLAFTGHEALHHLAPSDFADVHNWRERLIAPVTGVKALYYVTRMDHFLVVPALWALVVSLKSFYLEAKEGKR